MALRHNGLREISIQSLPQRERKALEAEVLLALNVRSYTRSELQDLLTRRGIRAELYLLTIVLSRLEADGLAKNDAGEWSLSHD